MKVTNEMKEKINFLYYETACNVSMIAKNLGISETTAAKYIGRRPEEATTPRPTQRRSSK